MDWDDLRYLLATARSGSFLGAAERLKVAHTTVGRRMKVLERDLGRPLFKRTRDGVELTEFCASLLPAAEAMEAQVQALRLTDRPSEQQPEGMVRVHTAPWIHQYILAPRMSTFHAAFPKVQLHLVGDVTNTITDHTVPGLSIRAEGMPKRDEVAIDPLHAPVSVYHHKDTDAQTAPWMTFHGGKMRGSPLTWMAERGIQEAQISAYTNDAEIIRRGLEGGGYKALIPHFLARLSPDLVRANSGPPDHLRTFRCITQRRTLKDPEIRAVLQWVRESLETSGLSDV